MNDSNGANAWLARHRLKTAGHTAKNVARQEFFKLLLPGLIPLLILYYLIALLKIVVKKVVKNNWNIVIIIHFL